MTFDLNEIEAAVIETMRSNEIWKRKRALTKDVCLAVSPNYFATPKDTICEVLSNRITARGFAVPDFAASDIGETDAGSVNFDLGSKCYLAMTWHRMPSGSFEIVAYIS